MCREVLVERHHLDAAAREAESAAYPQHGRGKRGIAAEVDLADLTKRDLALPAKPRINSDSMRDRWRRPPRSASTSRTSLA
jgi:hypothetical protein